MIETKVYGIDKKLARISEKEWRKVIYTKRDWKVWIRGEVLSVVLRWIARARCDSKNSKLRVFLKIVNTPHIL